MNLGSHAVLMFTKTEEGLEYVSTFLTNVHDILPLDQPFSVARFLNNEFYKILVRLFLLKNAQQSFLDCFASL